MWLLVDDRDSDDRDRRAAGLDHHMIRLWHKIAMFRARRYLARLEQTKRDLTAEIIRGSRAGEPIDDLFDRLDTVNDRIEITKEAVR